MFARKERISKKRTHRSIFRQMLLEQFEARHLMNADYSVLDTQLTPAAVYGNTAVIGSNLFFVDASPIYGIELHKLDTLTNQVSVVTDINPSAGDSNIGSYGGLVTYGNRLFFSAFDPAKGLELRWLDTSLTNPDLHTIDIANNSLSSDAGQYGFKTVGSKLYFSASDGINGTELWWTDMAASVPTASMLSIATGETSSNPGLYGGFTAVNDKLYFGAQDSNGVELRWIDTTLSTPTLHTAETIAGSGNPIAGQYGTFAAVGNYLYFTATDPTNGCELRWIDTSDASPTVNLIDVASGATSSSPGRYGGFGVAGSKFFFTAYDGTSYKLRWIDTAVSPSAINNLNYDSGDSASAGFAPSGSRLFFSASDASNGFELRWLDINSPSTVNIVNIASGPAHSHPGSFGGFKLVGDKLYFNATDPINGYELRWVDTKAATPTSNLISIANGTASSYAGRFGGFTPVGNLLYFTAADATGVIKLQSVDMTTDTLSSQSYPIFNSTGSSDAGIYGGIYKAGNFIYFAANDPTYGYDLRWIDITEPNQPVHTIDLVIGGHSYAGNFSGFKAIDNRLFFTASDAANGYELRWIDMTQPTQPYHTVSVASGSTNSNAGLYGGLVLVGDKLFFTASDAGNGYELRYIDNTQTEPAAITVDLGTGQSLAGQFGGFVVMGTKLYFTATDSSEGFELRYIDVSESPMTVGTISVTSGTGSSFGNQSTGVFMPVGSKLFFDATDPANGYELRWIDTTVTNPTVNTISISPGGGSAHAGYYGGFTLVGSKLYFTAADPTNGFDLRWIDTSLASPTVSTVNIASGANHSYSGQYGGFQAIGNRLYFSAQDPTNGYEMRWIDTTLATPTVNTIPLANGILSSNPGQYGGFTVLGNKLFFSGDDGVTGNELHWIDLTSEAINTVDIAEGALDSFAGKYGGFIVASNKIYFTATNPRVGQELMSYTYTSLPTAINISSNSFLETIATGSTVGMLSNNDPDNAQSVVDTYSYSLVSGIGSTDNASFSIVGNQLKTATTFNYETKNSYSIRVRATDQYGLTFDQVLTLSVIDVNNAPVLDTSGTMMLTSINETSTSSQGNTIQEIIASSGSDRISDLQSDPKGIAVIGTNATSGAWQYSIDNGNTWQALANATESTSRLLRYSDRVRFVPAGQITYDQFLEFRAWDQTSGTAGGIADTRINGGITAFSVNVERAGIALIHTNAAPTISSIANQAINEDGIISNLAFQVNDSDNGSVPLAIDVTSSNTALVPNSSITISGSGTNRYMSLSPVSNATGTAVITISVSDGPSSMMTSFTVTINAVNDAPISEPDNYRTQKNTTLTVSNAQGVLRNDYDLEHDSMTATRVAQALHGNATVNADGSFTYVPNTGYTGPDSFVYKATDSFGNFTSQTVNVTVAGGDVILVVAEDAQVNGATGSTGTNYGNDSTMKAQVNQYPIYSYLKFDLSAIDPNYTSAQLVLFSSSTSENIYMGSSSTTAHQRALDVSDSSWHQGTISYSGNGTTLAAPEVSQLNSKTPFDTWTTGGGYVTRDISTYLRSKFQGDELVSMAIAAGNSSQPVSYPSSSTVTYATKEDSDDAHKPKIVFSYGSPTYVAPTTQNATVSTFEDYPKVFGVADFPFSDADNDPLAQIKIASLPSVGSLELSGVPVQAGQFINRARIEAGDLVYRPVANAYGSPYSSFTFAVADAPDVSISVATMTINVSSANEAPLGTDTVVNMTEDSTHNFTIAEFGFTDPLDTPANTATAVKITKLPPGTDGKLRFFTSDVYEGQVIPVADIGNLYYQPTANLNGNYKGKFTFQVQDNGNTLVGDQNLDPTPNTLYFNIAAVNDAPSSSSFSKTILEDTPYSFTLSDFNFSDATDLNANSLAEVFITTVPLANEGTLKLNGVAVTQGQSISRASIPNLAFYPAANVNGNGKGNFTFQVRDNGGTSGGGIDLDPLPKTATFNITPVNDAPQGTDATRFIDYRSFDELSLSSGLSNALVYWFSANDFAINDSLDSPANSLLQVKILSLLNPQRGTLKLSGTAVTANQIIPVSQLSNLVFEVSLTTTSFEDTIFTFQVYDNGGTANQGQNADLTPRTFTLNAKTRLLREYWQDSTSQTGPASTNPVINQLPNSFVYANDDEIHIADHQGLYHLNVAANDYPGASQVTTSTTPNDANLSANGMYTFQAQPNNFGTRSFDYRSTLVSNASVSDTATIRIIVDNSPPVPAADSFTVSKNSAGQSLPIEANDFDINRDYVFAEIITLPQHGQLVRTTQVGDYGRNWIYIPTAGYTGTDSFTYQASDLLATGATVTVSLNIVDGATNAPTNDSFNLSHSSSGNLLNVTSNDSWSFGTSNVEIVTPPSHGTAQVLNGNFIRYSPVGTYTGSDSIVYRLTSGTNQSALATVSINLTNDTPVSQSKSLAVIAGETYQSYLYGSDIDLDGLTYSAVSQPSVGTLTLNPNGTLQYVAPTNWAGTTSFTYRDTDSLGAASTVQTVTITVSKNALILQPSTTIQSFDERESFTTVLATITSSLTTSLATDYSALIDWGDNRTSAGVIEAVGDHFVIKGSHQYLKDGRFAVTIVAFNLNGQQSIGRTAIDVIDEGIVFQQVADQTAKKGTPQTLTLARFLDDADTNPSLYSAMVNWGDGSPNQTVDVTGTDGTFAIDQGHLYAQNGTYTATTTINYLGQTYVNHVHITVEDNIVLSRGWISATKDRTANGTIAFFTSDSWNLNSQNFMAVISWGDGTSSIGFIEGQFGTFSVHGTHQYEMEGNYNIDVEVEDDDSNVAHVQYMTSAKNNDDSIIKFFPKNVEINASDWLNKTTFQLMEFEIQSDDPQYTDIDDYDISVPALLTNDISVVSLGGNRYAVQVKNSADFPYWPSFKEVGVFIQHEGMPEVWSLSTLNVISPPITITPVHSVHVPSNGQVPTSFTIATFTYPWSYGFGAYAIGDDNTVYTLYVQQMAGQQYAVIGSNALPDHFKLVVPSTDYHMFAELDMEIDIPRPQMHGDEDSHPPALNPVSNIQANFDPANVELAELELSTVKAIKGEAFSGMLLKLNGVFRNLRALIDWGDGTVSESAVQSNGEVSGTHTYSKVGIYSIGVLLVQKSDSYVLDFSHGLSRDYIQGGVSLGYQFSSYSDYAESVFGPFMGSDSALQYISLVAMVESEPLDFQAATPIQLDLNENYEGLNVGTLSANGSAVGVIDWGDGVTSFASIVNGQVNGSHQYTKQGTYWPRVHISDGWQVITGSFSVTVSSPVTNPWISYEQNDPLRGEVGEVLENIVIATFSYYGPTEIGALDSFIVDWGDGLKSNAKLTETGDHLFQVTGTHTYKETGSKLIKLRMILENLASDYQTNILIDFPNLSMQTQELTIPSDVNPSQLTKVLLATVDLPDQLSDIAEQIDAKTDWGNDILEYGYLAVAPDVTSVIQHGNKLLIYGNIPPTYFKGNYTARICLFDKQNDSVIATETLHYDVVNSFEGSLQNGPAKGMIGHGSFLFDHMKEAVDTSSDVTTGTLNLEGYYVAPTKEMYSGLAAFDESVAWGDGNSTEADRVLSYSYLSITSNASNTTSYFSNNWGPGSFITQQPFDQHYETGFLSLSIYGESMSNPAFNYIDAGSNTTTSYIGTTQESIDISEGVRTYKFIYTPNSGSGGEYTAKRYFPYYEEPNSSIYPTNVDYANALFGNGVLYSTTDPFQDTFSSVYGHYFGNEGSYNISSTFGLSRQYVVSEQILTDFNSIGDLYGEKGEATPSVSLGSFINSDYLDGIGGLTANIDWGDGSEPEEVTLVKNDAGTIEIRSTHTYSQVGNYNASILLDTYGGNKYVLTLKSHIFDTNLDLTPGTIRAAQNQQFNDAVVGKITDYDGAIDGFDVTIDWGDKDSNPGTSETDKPYVSKGEIVRNSQNEIEILGSHKYVSSGNYNVRIKLDDGATPALLKTGEAIVSSDWLSEARSRSEGDGSGDFETINLFQVGVNSGSLIITHDLDFDLSPGTDVSRNPQLVFNSDTTNQRPIVQAKITNTGSSLAPSQIKARLVVGDDAPTDNWVSFSTAGYAPGEDFLIALQFPNKLQETGNYKWRIDIKIEVAGQDEPVYMSQSGSANVVVRDNTDIEPSDPFTNTAGFGVGWGISTVDRVFPQLNGDVVYVDGRGFSRLFLKPSGDLSTRYQFESPAGEYGDLEFDPEASEYYYTSTHQSVFSFNGFGVMYKVSQPGLPDELYNYDDQGRLTTIQAIDGAVTTFLYDGMYLSRIVEPGNRQILMTYTGFDLTQIKDDDGTSRNFSYDASHNVTHTMWGIRESGFSYDDHQRLLGIELGLGSTYSIFPNSIQGLRTGPAQTASQDKAKVVDPLGRIELFELDEDGRLLNYDGPGLSSVHLTYDSRFNVISQTTSLGTSTFEYDSSGNLKKSTTLGQFDQTFQYDSKFNVPTSATDPSGTTTYTIDPQTGFASQITAADGGLVSNIFLNGLLMSSTRLGAATTNYLYDGNRRRTSESVTGLLSRSIAYDPYGNVYTETDGRGGVTRTIYDAKNRLVELRKAGDTASTYYEYDASGLLVAETAPEGTRTQYSYDQRGFQIAKVEGYNTPYYRGWSTVYDTVGNAILENEPGGVSYVHSYDDRNRRRSTLDQEGKHTTFDYDDNDNLIQKTDRAGRSTVYLYDTQGRQYGTIDALGRLSFQVLNWYGDVLQEYVSDTSAIPNTQTATLVKSNTYDALHRLRTTTVDGVTTTFDYDLAGNLIGITDGNGHVTTYGYDLLQHRTSQTDGAGKITTYSYDAEGGLTGVHDANGGITTYLLDGAGRTIQSTDPLQNVTQFHYDSMGNISWTRDAANHVTSFGYDLFNRKVTETNAAGDYKEFVYDSRDQLVADKDEAGRWTNRYYNSVTGRVTKIVDAMNGEWDFGYDDAGNTILQRDPLGRETTNQYDLAGRVIKSTAADGGQTSVTYDIFDNIKSITDPRNKTTSFEYDLNNRKTKQTDALSNVTTWVYDAVGNLRYQNQPGGRTTEYQYDQRNALIKTIDALGNQTINTYDNVGNLISVKDELLNTTNYQYDLDNRRIKQTDALNQSVEWTYDLVGNMLSQKDQLNHVTTYAYDALNRKTSTTDALNNTVEALTYDAVGNVLTRTNSLSEVTTMAYDALNRVTSTTAPGYGTTSNTYDAVGNLLTTTDASSHVQTFTYDVMNRKKTEKLANLTATQYAYDLSGNLTLVTDPLGHTTSYAYDALNRMSSSTDTNNGVTSYAYDSLSNRTSLTDSVGNTTAWVYDLDNRLTSETKETGQTESYTYDAVGNRLSITKRDGNKIAYTYDPIGRVTQENWLVGTTVVNTLGFSYDAAGELTDAVSGTTDVALTYDALGRLATEHQTYSSTVNVLISNSYNTEDQRTQRNLAINGTADSSTTYSYLPGSLLNKIQTSGSTVISKRIDYTYQTNGQTASRTAYEDLAGTKKVYQATYSYDTANRLLTLAYANPAATTIDSYGYTYDAAGRITAINSLVDGSTTYAYDNVDQLTSVNYATLTDESFGYDANGNRSGAGYATGDDNQTTSAGQFSYNYDANGNLIKRTNTSNGSWTEYTYDHRDRLVAVTQHASSNAVLEKVTYQYDALNRLIAKSVDTNGDGTFEQNEYLVNDGMRSDRDNAGDQLAAILNTSGAVQNRYLYGKDVDEVLSEENLDSVLGTFNDLWTLGDHQNSVRDVIDYNPTTNAATIVDHVAYSAFGDVIAETAPATDRLFGYTGREWDDDADLQFNRARWYDPTLGKWISQDPIKFDAGDTNIYRIVGNHPVYANDPNGFEETTDPYENYGPWSKSLAHRAEASRKAGNPFGHIFFGIMVGPAALFDAVPFDIKRQAANARQDLLDTVAATDDPITKAVGIGVYPLVHGGEFLAQGANSVGAVGSLLPALEGIAAAPGGAVLLNGLGAFASNPVVATTVGGALTVKATREAIHSAEQGTFSSSDIFFVTTAATPLIGPARNGIRALSQLQPNRASLTTLNMGVPVNLFKRSSASPIATIAEGYGLSAEAAFPTQADNFAAASGRFLQSRGEVPRGEVPFAGYGALATIVAPTVGRPRVNSSLPGQITHELPAGSVRTPAEVKQARNFFKRNRDAAKQWYEQRAGALWPDDATHFEHLRPIKDGGDPLFVEPGFGGPKAAHMIPGQDGLTDFQRWGRLGGRPPKQ